MTSRNPDQQTNVLADVNVRRKKISEYDQEIPQSQTADNPAAPPIAYFGLVIKRGRFCGKNPEESVLIIILLRNEIHF